MKSVFPLVGVYAAEPHVVCVLFAEVQWNEGTERYVTAGADVTWDGYTWKGVGDLIDISPIVETDAVEATSVRFTLAMVAGSRVAQALTTKSQGRKITLWFGVMNENMNVISLPVVEFVGLMDAPQLVDGDTATLSITAESELAGLLGASVRRYTDADQQQYHPGDTWCQFMSSMAERLIVFPSAQALRR